MPISTQKSTPRPRVRSVVRAILESHEGYVVCGEAADGAEAVKKVLDSDPDVVILDTSMPLLNGIDAAREIARERPHIPVIILSVHAYSQFSGVKGIGVKGYVTKTRIGEELIQAVEAVANGHSYFPD